VGEQLMGTFAKVLGWTIAGVVVIKLGTSGNFGNTVANIGSAWSGVLKSISGG
jgi:hypothetical protein